MRHAVAPAENVENNSFAVTNLFKICTHCERLSKKVRERKQTLRAENNVAFLKNASLQRDVWI